MAQQVRDYLEPFWERFHANTRNNNLFTTVPDEQLQQSLGSSLCCHSALFLKYLLKDALGQDWRITGGITRQPDADFQYENYGDGRHFWVQKDGIILDITADQLGTRFSAVTVTDVNDPRYLEMPQYTASEANGLKGTVKQWTGEEPVSYWSATEDTQQIRHAYQALTVRCREAMTPLRTPTADPIPSL